MSRSWSGEVVAGPAGKGRRAASRGIKCIDDFQSYSCAYLIFDKMGGPSFFSRDLQSRKQLGTILHLNPVLTKRHVTVMRSIVQHGLRARNLRLLRPVLPTNRLNNASALTASTWTTKRLNSSTATLHYPEPPTANHNDLTSFLKYVERSGLDPKTTLYVGTHYEYTIAQVLSRFGFYLRRVGGHSDYGIDLLGTWTVPSSSKPLKVLVQCKAIARKSTPNLVRELEGAFVGAPVGWKGHGVLGIFVTEKTATKGVRDSLGRSRWPMVFISCTREGWVQQMLWNQRAEEEGLEGLGVGMRHVGPDGEPQLLLTWKGQHLTVEDGPDVSESAAAAEK